jgi:uncharacterized lipoprotein YbaY
MKKRIICTVLITSMLLFAVLLQSCTSKATAISVPKTTTQTEAQKIHQDTTEIKSTLANLSGADSDIQVALKKIQTQLDVINAKLGIK